MDLLRNTSISSNSIQYTQPPVEVKIVQDRTQKILEAIDRPKVDLQTLNECQAELLVLLDEVELEHDQQEKKKLCGDVDHLLTECNELLKTIGKDISAINGDIIQFRNDYVEQDGQTIGPTSASTLESGYNNLLEKFKKSMLKIGQTSDEIKKRRKNRVVRLAKALIPDCSDEIIEKITHAPDPDQIFDQVMMGENHEEIINKVEGIRLRNEGVRALEQRAIQLLEMSNEFKFLVELQGKVIQNVSDMIANTVEYTGAGNKNMTQAREYQKSSNKSIMCWIGGVLLLVALIAGVVIILQVTKKKKE
jgi:syntaxin 1B/2/3